jgi:hypothetical protein
VWRYVGGCRSLDAALQNFRINEVTAALPGYEIPVIFQGGIGQHHGIAANAELLRQPAAGGQGPAGGDMPVEDAGGYLLPQLLLQAARPLGR